MTNVTVKSQIYRLFILCSSVSVRWFLKTKIPFTAQNNRQPFNKVNKRDVSTDANCSWHRHKRWLNSLLQFLGNLRHFAVMLRNLHSDTETKQKRMRKRVFPPAKVDTRRWMLRDSVTSRKFECWWVWTCMFPPAILFQPIREDAVVTLPQRYPIGKTDISTVGGTRAKRSQWAARQEVFQGISTQIGFEQVFKRSRQSYWKKDKLKKKKKKKEYKKNSFIQM